MRVPCGKRRLLRYVYSSPTPRAWVIKSLLSFDIASATCPSTLGGQRVAGQVEPHRIFEALAVVRQMSREGHVRKTRGALFGSLLRSRLKSAQC